MNDIEYIKTKMEEAQFAMCVLGIYLTDYPDKQKEVYGAAEMLKEWQEEIGK